MAHRRLKYCAAIEMGQSPPSSAYEPSADGLPFLQGNAEFGPRHPTPRLQCDVAPKRCRKGDLLFSVRAPVGAANVADREYGIGRGLCAIAAGPGLDSRFLWYLAPLLASELAPVAVGSTYDAVSVEDVGNVRVPLPPLDVQRRTVELLDAESSRIDRLLGLHERLLDRLRERRRALIVAAVTGRPLPLTASPS